MKKIMTLLVLTLFSTFLSANSGDKILSCKLGTTRFSAPFSHFSFDPYSAPDYGVWTKTKNGPLEISIDALNDYILNDDNSKTFLDTYQFTIIVKHFSASDTYKTQFSRAESFEHKLGDAILSCQVKY